METIKVKVGWENSNYSACTDNFDTLNGIIIATGKTFEGLKKKFNQH